MKKTFALALGAVTVLLLLGVGGFQWYAMRYRPQAWYPFISSLVGEMYVASPTGFASNIRDDNPAWQALPSINRTVSRMTYVMTRGVPDTDIAWLMTAAEFPDKADMNAGVAPNRHESAISRDIHAAGLSYDRISRRNLLSATIQGKALQVGAMQYRALLVDRGEVMAPELLEEIHAIANQGIPVLWVGSLPVRAPGWASHAARDRAVAGLARALQGQIHRFETATLAPPAVQALVPSRLLPPGHTASGLKLQRRVSGGTTWFLIFNDSPVELRLPLDPALGQQPLTVRNPQTGDRSPVTGSAPEIRIPAGKTRILQVGSDSPDWDAQEWQSPSMLYRPYIRWWWPGNAVEKTVLAKDLQGLYRAGFGGVEIQTLTFGLAKGWLRQQASAVYAVGTPGWFANVRFACEQARSVGMACDLTLGSGWPLGMPSISEHPEQQLLMSSRAIGAEESSLVLPVPHEPLYARVGNWLVDGTQGAFDEHAKLVAVTAARESGTGQLLEMVDLTDKLEDGHIAWQAPAGQWRLFAFYQNATHHNVLGSAYPGAEVFRPGNAVNVIDHLDRAGIDEYIAKLGKPWLEQLAPYKPGTFFVDSFELIGELPWSARFRAAFARQHGYDLTPYLPLVFRRYGESKYLNMIITPSAAFQSDGEQGQRVREDYESTRESLFLEEHIQPLRQWLASEGILLRLQAHGGFGDYLDSYQAADIPESEGLFANGNFEFLALAASAGHVAGRPVISSETFVAMSVDPDRFTPDDYLYLAGNAYAAGINRLVYHGHAYPLCLERCD